MVQNLEKIHYINIPNKKTFSKNKKKAAELLCG